MSLVTLTCNRVECMAPTGWVQRPRITMELDMSPEQKADLVTEILGSMTLSECDALIRDVAPELFVEEA